MLILIALGGNALLKRGEPVTTAAQWGNVRNAARAIASVAGEHQLVITHGNGPQAGLLALQAAAYEEAEPYSLDIIGAATAGMIGYMIEHELGNCLGYDVPIATMLTRVCVDAEDPAFKNPTKFVGPVYDAVGAKKLELEKGWAFQRDNQDWRRVVPSPEPQCIVWHRPIRWLMGQKALLICAGGGGIPVIRDAESGRLTGVEAVIDKDRTSSLLAKEIAADLFIIATDVDGVYDDFGTPHERLIKKATPQALEDGDYSSGSMGPKVEAASWFVRQTGKRAVIGSLNEIENIICGRSGTSIEADNITS